MEIWHLVHAIIALFTLAINLWALWKGNLKIPFYIHFIAGIAVVLGIALIYGQPINSWWMVLIMPALVYAAFLAYSH
ncbi:MULTISPECIES: hypothetical protein [Aerosakkonema]|uniref:hypothetical protein n=1 Tax=Aerosakkonema TaxID=1246629 RepID=UPI0035BBB746